MVVCLFLPRDRLLVSPECKVSCARLQLIHSDERALCKMNTWRVVFFFFFFLNWWFHSCSPSTIAHAVENRWLDAVWMESGLAALSLDSHNILSCISNEEHFCYKAVVGVLFKCTHCNPEWVSCGVWCVSRRISPFLHIVALMLCLHKRVILRCPSSFMCLTTHATCLPRRSQICNFLDFYGKSDTCLVSF